MNHESIAVRVQVNEGSNRGVLVLLVPTKCTVQDLKALLFKYHKIPTEVQTWFRDDKQSLGLMDDQSAIEEEKGLCVYIRPMALCKENVRRSDFEKWHEEITSMDVPVIRVNADSSMRDVRSKTATHAGPLDQPAAPAGAAMDQFTKYRQPYDLPRAAATHGAYRGAQSMSNRPKVEIFSDYCHLCGEPPVVFCFTCDDKHCYFCNSCSGVIHSDGSSQTHDVVPVAEVTIPKHPDHLRINNGHPGARSGVMLEADKITLGWKCVRCTYVNFPTRPGCEVCSSDRPRNYQAPAKYVMSDKEKQYLALIKKDELKAAAIKQQEIKNRQERIKMYKRLDGAAVIQNDAEFECIICFSRVAKGNGIILHSCLHSFCRECLKQHIESSEGAEIKCPFNADDHTCEQVLEEREIREVAPKFLMTLHERALRTAEAQSANSFHCQTANCRGWCIYEDGVNKFKCYVCGQQNCLSCKVQHPGLNCQEYQDDLRLRAQNDIDARNSLNAIEDLLKIGEARHCPKCRVIMLKNGGCDHMKCAVCHLDFSWASVAPR